MLLIVLYAWFAFQVCYQMKLSNGVEVCAVLYIVHTQATQSHDDNSVNHTDFQWACVSRSKGCISSQNCLLTDLLCQC